MQITGEVVDKWYEAGNNKVRLITVLRQVQPLSVQSRFADLYISSGKFEPGFSEAKNSKKKESPLIKP